MNFYRTNSNRRAELHPGWAKSELLQNTELLLTPLCSSPNNRLYIYFCPTPYFTSSHNANLEGNPIRGPTLVFPGDSEWHWAAESIYLEHASHVWNKTAGFHLKPSEKPSSSHKIHPGMVTKAVNQEERERGSRHTSLLRSVATEPLSLSLSPGKEQPSLAWCCLGGLVTGAFTNCWNIPQGFLLWNEASRSTGSPDLWTGLLQWFNFLKCSCLRN